MSTLQHANPRRANQSMTEESGLPGTLRSNVGCEAIDEPCTNRTAGLAAGEPTNFSQRKRRTSPLCVQCSTPLTGASPGEVPDERGWGSSLACVRAEPLISLTWVGAIRGLRRVARAGRRADSRTASTTARATLRTSSCTSRVAVERLMAGGIRLVIADVAIQPGFGTGVDQAPSSRANRTGRGARLRCPATSPCTTRP